VEWVTSHFKESIKKVFQAIGGLFLFIRLDLISNEMNSKNF
jgi:hypothetical protein